MKPVKGTLICLLSCLTLFVTAVPIQAKAVDTPKSYSSGVSTTNKVGKSVGIDLPFDYNKPSSNTEIFNISSFSSTVDSNGNPIPKLNLEYGSDVLGLCLSDSWYKVVVYDSSTDKFYSCVTDYSSSGEITSSENVNIEKNSFADALKASEEIQGYGYFATIASDTSYILIFKGNATKLSDALYIVKYTDTLGYTNSFSDNEDEEVKDEDSSNKDDEDGEIKDEDSSNKDDEGGGSSSKDDYSEINGKSTLVAETVNEIISDGGSVHGANVKLTWNIDSSFKDDYAAFIFIDGDRYDINEKLDSSYTLTLTELINKDYKILVETIMGVDVYCNYTVDFCKDEVNTYDPNEKAIKVTFSGFPEGNVMLGDTVTLKMTTNIPTVMNFNGEILGNGEYGTSFEFTVSENDNYHYSVSSKSGNSKSGYLDIDFFKDFDEIDDPINNDLIDSNEDSGNTLAKTGINFNINIVLIGVLLLGVGIFVLSRNRFSYKGEGTE